MALFTVQEMELLAAYHKNGLALFIFSLLNKKEEQLPPTPPQQYQHPQVQHLLKAMGIITLIAT